jgi:hypothetical protein
MSVSPIAPPVLDPAVIGIALEAAPKRNKATDAAVTFLLSDNPKKRKDALDHLVAICRLARANYKRRDGGRLYLWDEWSELAVQFQPDDIGSKSGRENTEQSRLRDWIQFWILKKLARYHGRPAAEIEEAAANGKFRKLGLWCIIALRREIARLYPEDGVFTRVCGLLNESYETDDGETGELANAVTGPPINVNASFDPKDLMWIVNDYRHEFDRLRVTEVATEILRGLRLPKGETTRNVAARLGVGVRQARNRIRQCYEILRFNRDRPAVKKLYEALDYAAVPNHARYALAVKKSQIDGPLLKEEPEETEDIMPDEAV